MDDIRMPPQNLEAERCVLGSMCFHEEALEHGISALKSSDFYGLQNGKLFDVLRDMKQRQMVVDIVTLSDAVARRGIMEEIGGVAYLMDILNCVPTWAHVRYYAKIVKRESVRRRLIGLGLAAQHDGYDQTVDLEVLVQRFTSGIDNLVAERSDDHRTIAEVITEMRDQERHPQIPFSTGLEDLDKMLSGGLRRKALSVLAARPSIGKTSLGIQFCEAAARASEPALFISIEMSSVEIALRISQQGSRRCDEVSTLPFFIEDRLTHLDEVLDSIRLAKRRHGVKIVVIDYLQLMKTNDRLQKHEKIELCTNELKQVAKELQIAVVALAQLNRESEKRDDKRPRLSDLKGAGGIEESSDVVMLLHRPDFYDENDSPGVAEIIVAKNRNGSRGTVQCGFVKEKTMFVPYASRPVDVSKYEGPAAPF